jgi:DNA-binding transcriptional regulator YiaG
VVLLPTGSISQPGEFMRLLWSNGLSLKKARAALERLATKKPTAVDLNVEQPDELISRLAKLGVIAAIFEVSDIDVRQLREEQSLSQPDFVHLYGLEVDTVKNWEQGRYKPDGPAKVLLNVIRARTHNSGSVSAAR